MPRYSKTFLSFSDKTTYQLKCQEIDAPCQPKIIKGQLLLSYSTVMKNFCVKNNLSARKKK